MYLLNWPTVVAVNYYTQAWYALPILFLLVNCTSMSVVSESIGNAISTTCMIPGISSTSFCATLSSRRDIERGVWSPVVSGVKPDITSLEEVLIHSFLSKALTSADVSIGDAVFMVESSQMERHDDIVQMFNRVKEDSITVTRRLLGLRAQTAHYTNIAISTIDQLLERIVAIEDEQLHPSWLCTIPFTSCTSPDSVDIEDRLGSFNFMMETIRIAVVTLYPLINSLESLLQGLDTNLDIIRRLIAAESALVIQARNEILSDPLYKLGIRRSQIILQHYESRLQASASVLAFHRYANDHVTNARGRLSAVEEELKVLEKLVEQPNSMESNNRFRRFVEALRNGVLRLQSVQYALSGEYVGVSGYHRVQQLIEGAQAFTVPPKLIEG